MKEMNQKISIIGAGSWGTTLAILLAEKNIPVSLHSVFKEHNQRMQKERMNRLFLKGFRFPPSLEVVTSLRQALESEIIVVAIPVKFIRKVLKRISKNLSSRNKIFLSVSKGIERNSLKRPSQIIEEEIGKVKIGVLSGPNIAYEVIRKIPSVSVAASSYREVALKIQKIFSTSYFRVYTHDDLVGVELAGALKNIIALACGISDGLGLGTNTKSALVTRGLVELARLGEKVGAKKVTFWGVAGLGDLVTTCFSPYSRNRFVGEEIGKGKKLKEVVKKMKMVAEGVETVKSAYQLSKKLDVEMPITQEVYSVLYKNKSPHKAVKNLMERPLKEEIPSF